MRHWTVAVATFASLLAGPAVRAGDVRGRVSMPEACAPAVSPAVVVLEPASSSEPPKADAQHSELLSVDQRALQFAPRVVAARPGDVVRFTNGDMETHNVHVLGVRGEFSRAIGPGQVTDLVVEKPGLLRVVCDIHSSMRAFVFVSSSPWNAVCDRNGEFRIRGVPAGDYVLRVWHELGQPLEQRVTIAEGARDLGELQLAGPKIAAEFWRELPNRPWPEVVDRISVLLASSLDQLKRKNGSAKAIRFVDDAYFAEFEASDMETAVRSYLGAARTYEIEDSFRSLRKTAKLVASGAKPASAFTTGTRSLLKQLLDAHRDLIAKGITDRSKVLATANSGGDTAPSRMSDDSGLAALGRSFGDVSRLANDGNGPDAAERLGEAYWDDFEPIERDLLIRNPSVVKPLESRFNTLRGRLTAGLRGEELRGELERLQVAVGDAVRGQESGSASSFGIAFTASFGTILREGIEVILILTMLLALAEKTGQPRARRALNWGVGIGLLASVVTAVALNQLVAASRGRTREMLEGFVMLTAAGVLFYVSYWLISQSQAKRWMSFLQGHARLGGEAGKFSAIGVTAFLAVYREGAETALMYQSLFAVQTSRIGWSGIVAGFCAGVVALAIVYLLLRKTTLKLPLRLFFQATGVLLFALAVVFAGSGVFELQSAEVLKITPLGTSILGSGIPAIGLYPTAQGLGIQGVLLAGAIVAGVLSLTSLGTPGPTSRERVNSDAGSARTPVAAGA